MSQVRHTRIAGTGAYLPEKRLTNKMLEERGIGTTDEWIIERTGIRERRMVEPGTPVSAVALPAAQQAIEAASISPEQVDAILFGTSTPDSISPPSACMLQRDLGAINAPAFDLIAGCSGFVVGLDIARAMVASSIYQNVLVVGADVMTSVVDPLQREVCVIFGDGAGAALVQPCSNDGKDGESREQGRILHSIVGAQGDNELMYVKSGGSAHPTSEETVARREQFFQMAGRKVYKFAVKKIETLVRQIVAEAGLELADVDWFVPHQMNELILRNAFEQQLEIPFEKVVMNVGKYGNTTAGTVPIALDEAVRDGRIQPGDLVVMVVVGAGLSWGANLVRW